MTSQQLQQKVNEMKLHQQKLLQPHTELDAQFDNEWFTHVNNYMAHEYSTLDTQSNRTIVSRITLQEVTAAVKQLRHSRHPGHDNILNDMLMYGGDALRMLQQLFGSYPIELFMSLLCS